MSSTYRKSLPIILPSFVNKCGDIGMRLFPMLLVEQHLAVAQASLVMALVKGATILSAFLGGLLGDRIGHKRTILLSMLLSALGMALLPVASSAVVICLVGMVATFGQGLFSAPLRLLLVRTVPVDGQKEALAWLRTANNGAVMTANAVAYLTSGIGLVALFIFDAATSFFAAGVAAKIMPAGAPEAREVGAGPVRRWGIKGMTPVLLLTTLLISGFTLQTELFFVSTSAQARMSFGARGVEVFAQVMMINTFLCMAFNVLLTRFIHSEVKAFLLGLALQSSGLLLFLSHKETMTALFIGVFLQSLGELTFSALSQITLIRLMPAGSRQGGLYGMALMVQLCGKMLGAALAFPVVTGGGPAVWGVGLGSLVLCLLVVPLAKRLRVLPVI